MPSHKERQVSRKDEQISSIQNLIKIGPAVLQLRNNCPPLFNYRKAMRLAEKL
jgi:hypothetical protein